MPGLHLAFRDRQRVALSGRTIRGEDATRDVWVCGPGSYVVLKALAFGSRGENKDAYDLFYVVRNFGSGVEDIAVCLRPLLVDPAGRMRWLFSGVTSRITMVSVPDAWRSF